jgi:hypothetical protein
VTTLEHATFISLANFVASEFQARSRVGLPARLFWGITWAYLS